MCLVAAESTTHPFTSMTMRASETTTSYNDVLYFYHICFALWCWSIVVVGSSLPTHGRAFTCFATNKIIFLFLLYMRNGWIVFLIIILRFFFGLMIKFPIVLWRPSRSLSHYISFGNKFLSFVDLLQGSVHLLYFNVNYNLLKTRESLLLFEIEIIFLPKVW